jgi:hypothetical protein
MLLQKPIKIKTIVKPQSLFNHENQTSWGLWRRDPFGLDTTRNIVLQFKKQYKYTAWLVLGISSP